MPLSLAAAGSKYTPSWHEPRQGRRARDDRNDGPAVDDAPAARRHKMEHANAHQAVPVLVPPRMVSTNKSMPARSAQHSRDSVRSGRTSIKRNIIATPPIRRASVGGSCSSHAGSAAPSVLIADHSLGITSAAGATASAANTNATCSTGQSLGSNVILPYGPCLTDDVQYTQMIMLRDICRASTIKNEKMQINNEKMQQTNALLSRITDIFGAIASEVGLPESITKPNNKTTP